MPRAGWKKRWIKLYPLECLEGSIRYQLEADERGVWYDLLNFAAVCDSPGIISDRDGRPYPHPFIANRLNISLELLDRTLKKCVDEGRISENEHGVVITNWKFYQSEYERQKPYRQAKQGKVIAKVCPKCGWKGTTGDDTCPDCKEMLNKDYRGGKYGHIVQH